jgi:hypothetical protein
LEVFSGVESLIAYSRAARTPEVFSAERSVTYERPLDRSASPILVVDQDHRSTTPVSDENASKAAYPNADRF